jgi:hypothetical protein
MANVTVTFGDETRANGAITPSWIAGAIDSLDRVGKPICGLVHVVGGDINLSLPLGACPPSGGRGRYPNVAESEIIDRWRRLHLDQPRIVPGQLEAFVRQVLRL